MTTACLTIVLAMLFNTVYTAKASEQFRDEQRYLHEIEIVASSYNYRNFSRATSQRFEVWSSAGAKLTQFMSGSELTVLASDVGRMTIEVPINALSSADSSSSDKYLLPSFIVDYEEDSVQALTRAFRNIWPEGASYQAGTDFIDDWISEKSLARGFDIASKVARSKVGDCTEHSVLLTGLNRSLGKPARLIVGVVVIGFKEGLNAFGHAWTEVFSDNQWHLADAALNGLEEPHFYMPFGVFENEGPGYLLEMIEFASRIPDRIVFIQ